MYTLEYSLYSVKSHTQFQSFFASIDSLALKIAREPVHFDHHQCTLFACVATIRQFIHSNCELIRQGVRQQIEFDVYLVPAIILSSFFSLFHFLVSLLIFGLSRRSVFRPFTFHFVFSHFIVLLCFFLYRHQRLLFFFLCLVTLRILQILWIYWRRC